MVDAAVSLSIPYPGFLPHPTYESYVLLSHSGDLENQPVNSFSPMSDIWPYQRRIVGSQHLDLEVLVGVSEMEHRITKGQDRDHLEVLSSPWPALYSLGIFLLTDRLSHVAPWQQAVAAGA